MSGTHHTATEEDEYLAVVRRFCVKSIAPAAAEIDRTDQWFPDLMADAASLGLQSLLIDDDGLFAPEHVGLADRTTELIASYSPSVGIAIGAARLHSLMLAQFGSSAVRDRWLKPILAAEVFGSIGISESGAGSDIRAGQTVARRDGGGWVLNGAKAWTTLSPVADFTVVLAKIDNADRDALMGMFLVERGMDGFSHGANEPLISYRGVPMAATYFDDVWVPDENVLSAADGFAGILQALNFARVEAAALGRGIMRGCLRHVAAYAAERVVFERPLASHQATQLRAANMAIRLEAARGLSRSAAESFATGAPHPQLCAAAKAYAAEAAMQSATEAVSLFGGLGVTQQFEIERYFRDAKATEIFDGTGDVLALQVGRWALGRSDW